MTDTASTASKPSGRFDFHLARTACRDILDALADQGLTVHVDNLSGGCAGIRIPLPDGTALLISDLDGSLPLKPEARFGWIVEHTMWQHSGPNGYPGEPITNVYTSTAPGDDTAAMLAAVTTFITAQQSLA